VDKLLRTSPAQGIAEVLKIAGVTPEQYARHVLGQSAQQPQAGQPAPQQPTRDPQIVGALTQQQEAIKALSAQLENMNREKVESEVHNSIIAPFRAEHPRYAELEPQMATILQSGLVPENLTPRQRLETAYDMAERLSPRSVSSDPFAGVGPDDNARRENSAGGKSVKGAPSPGTSVDGRAGQVMDRKAAVRAAMAELGR